MARHDALTELANRALLQAASTRPRRAARGTTDTLPSIFWISITSNRSTIRSVIRLATRYSN